MQYKFLSEHPITDSHKFGHKEILESLQSIVTSCSTPFTIGLFGKWGSGKSSIAESLQTKLLPLGIPIVLFDVWKHEGDALRRTFLKELVRQLTSKKYGPDYFNKDFVLDPKLDAHREVTKTGNVNISYKVLKPLLGKLGIVLCIFIVLSIGIWALGKLLPTQVQLLVQNGFNQIFTLASLTAVFAWIFNNLKDFVAKSEVSVVHERITDPHEFEKEFKRILNALSNSRIVIIFDNLDRVSGENALEIISTIKTFLEPIDRDIKNKEVVFLIPCDVDAIKKHLKKVLRDEIQDLSELETYSDEFLRKFFNTILWIPDFYSIELESFATEKLKETQIPEFDNEHLGWLIIQVFKENPRQIIQFINILISNFVLLERKSKENAFGDLEFHKKNVPQLAKYLLLIQKFPVVMQRYKTTKTYDLNSNVIGTSDHSTVAEFNEFRIYTSDIVISSLEPFFNFKISEQEKSIPGISKLFSLLADGKMEEEIENAKTIGVASKSAEFSDALNNYLASKNNSILVCIFLNGLFELTSKLNIILRASSYREIQKKFESANITSLEKIDPHLITIEFFIKGQQSLNQSVREKVLTRWVNILSEKYSSPESMQITRGYLLSLVTEIQRNHNHLTAAVLQQYQKVLSQHCASDIEICTIVIQDVQADRFITTGLIQNILANLTLSKKEDGKDFINYVSLIERVKDEILGKTNEGPIIQKLTELINSEAQSKEYESKGLFIEKLSFLIKTFLINDKVSDATLINNLANSLLNAYYQSRWSHNHLYLPLYYTLELSRHNTFKDHGRSVRVEFFQNLQNMKEDNVKYVLDRYPTPSVILDQPAHTSIIQDLISQSEPYFKLLYKYSSPVTKSNFILRLVQNNRFTWLINSLEVINGGQIENKQAIFDSIASRLRSFASPKALVEPYQFLNQVNISIQEVNTDKFEQVIFDFVQSPAIREVVPGYFDTSKHLNPTNKLRICQKVLSHIPNDPYNNVALEILKKEYKILSVDNQREFKEIVFQRLLVSPPSDVWITMGMTILLDLNVSLDVSHLDILKSKAIEYKTANNHSWKDKILTAMNRFLQKYAEGTFVELREWLTSELTTSENH